jgi:DNA-binding transcriptional MerR regulator/methylmalonyl-CoA mutase cobalamin-binding subunit
MDNGEREERVYSVKMASQVTGISTDTLRAWERRYGVVRPKRAANGRRLYDAADIARLRLLRQVVALGHSIQRVAPLSDAELEGILSAEQQVGPERPATDLVDRVLRAVDHYRPDLCDEALGLAIAALSPRHAVRYVLAPALVEAGERWHRRRWSAAQEHLLTASVERLVMVTMHTYQKAAWGPGIVFGTLPGERHVLGSLLAAFLAASHGLRCCYLGADLPPEELAEAARKSRSAVVAVSLVDLFENNTVVSQIEILCQNLDQGKELWLGGSGTEKLKQEALPSQCHVLEDFDAFIERADTLRRTLPS